MSNPGRTAQASVGVADEALPAELHASLIDLLGAGAVLTEAEQRRLHSTDVYSAGALAAAVVRPGSTAQLAQAVAMITAAGFAVAPRGGGMSYTGGYTPVHSRTVIVDVSGLNRIVEIASEDRFITVEAGVTWRQVYEALQPLGLRLPFFGTFSGTYATVGGGLSNGALFMATARYGTAADIVLGLEVVTARGEVLETGQAGFRNGRPFYRTQGPDLTGLFLHDAGALGIKTRASLRLIESPSCLEYISFAFASESQAMAALSGFARSDAAEEAYVFDPETTARSLSDHPGLRQDLKTLSAVVGGQSSLLQGLREGARMVAAGRDFATGWTLHAVCAGRNAAAVRNDREHLRQLGVAAGGTEIANSIPKAARAAPFGPLNGIIGHQGERWAALNAKVAHSDAPELVRQTRELLAGYEARMADLGVSMSFLYIAIGNHAFSYEPVLRWNDEWLPLHRHIPERDYLQRLTEPVPDPAARALVHEIRGAIVRLFARFGAASNQLGKTYPYFESLKPQGQQVMLALKQQFDPDGLMNPGALALPHPRHADNLP